MKKINNKGFIAITVIYSFFIIFISVMLLLMYKYISNRKISSRIKSELVNTIRKKAPNIVISPTGSYTPHESYDVTITLIDGGNGIANAYYDWSTNITHTPTTPLTQSTIISSPSANGIYYLTVKACDYNNNCKTAVSNAFMVNVPLICKKATVLHTEVCNNSLGDEYCKSLGYYEGGSKGSSTITYGKISTNATLNVGDAYDCDVNGDGTYDPATERFYYVSDYYDTVENKYNTSYATLVYYTNVQNGQASPSYKTAYSSGTANLGPTVAVNNLPSSSSWSNVELKATTRTISSYFKGIGGFEFDYKGKVIPFAAPQDGDYLVQAWGAGGGRAVCNGNTCGTAGKGGYAEGIINLTKGDQFYVYVGEKGKDGIEGMDSQSTFNGGGLGTWDHNDNEVAGSGGGASDIRLVDGIWSNPTSLASRILVAGGGGGIAWSNTTAGSGGGVSGTSGNETTAAGATQITGGSFGVGQNGTGNGYDSRGCAGAGGGYWGGVAAPNKNTGAGGGSGYISGHTGCVAIKAADDTSARLGTGDATCDDGTTDNLCSVHYLNKVFTDTILTDGTSSMPTFDGESTMTGNSGNGYVKISLQDNLNSVTPTTFNYAYTNKSSRLLNIMELTKCNDMLTTKTTNNKVNNYMFLKDKCAFLFENTKFANENNSSEGFWIENASSNDSNFIMSTNANQFVTSVYTSTSSNVGVRPVIEVHKSRMEI